MCRFSVTGQGQGRGKAAAGQGAALGGSERGRGPGGAGGKGVGRQGGSPPSQSRKQARRESLTSGVWFCPLVSTHLDHAGGGERENPSKRVQQAGSTLGLCVEGVPPDISCLVA